MLDSTCVALILDRTLERRLRRFVQFGIILCVQLMYQVSSVFRLIFKLIRGSSTSINFCTKHFRAITIRVK